MTDTKNYYGFILKNMCGMMWRTTDTVDCICRSTSIVPLSRCVTINNYVCLNELNLASSHYNRYKMSPLTLTHSPTKIHPLHVFSMLLYCNNQSATTPFLLTSLLERETSRLLTITTINYLHNPNVCCCCKKNMAISGPVSVFLVCHLSFSPYYIS